MLSIPLLSRPDEASLAAEMYVEVVIRCDMMTPQ